MDSSVKKNIQKEKKNSIPIRPFYKTLFFNPSKKEYHLTIIKNNLTLKFSFYLSEMIYDYHKFQKKLFEMHENSPGPGHHDH